MKEKPRVPHINARAETVHEKPLFREALDKCRCLIPATDFYEWQKRADGKQPYRSLVFPFIFLPISSAISRSEIGIMGLLLHPGREVEGISAPALHRVTG